MATSVESIRQMFALLELLLINSRIIWSKLFDLIAPQRRRHTHDDTCTRDEMCECVNCYMPMQPKNSNFLLCQYEPYKFYRTFDNWPGPRNLVARFSQTGFSYTGRDDVVQCNGCGLMLAEWIATDDPKTIHDEFDNEKKCIYRGVE